MLKKKKEMLPLVLGGLGPLQGLPDSGGTPGHQLLLGAGRGSCLLIGAGASQPL